MNSGTRENLRIVPMKPGPFDSENMVLVNCKLINFADLFKYSGKDDDCYCAHFNTARFNTSSFVKVHATPAEVNATEWAMTTPVRFAITRVVGMIKSVDGEVKNAHGEFVDQYGRCAVEVVRVNNNGSIDDSTMIVLILNWCGSPVFLEKSVFPQFPEMCATWELERVHIADASHFCRDGTMSKIYPDGPRTWPASAILTHVRPSLVETTLSGPLKHQFERYEFAYSAFGTTMLTTGFSCFDVMMPTLESLIPQRGPAGMLNHTSSCPPYPRADPRLFGRTARRVFGTEADDERHAALCMAREMTDSPHVAVGQTFSEDVCVRAACLDAVDEGGSWEVAERVSRLAIEMLVASTRIVRFGDGMLRWSDFQRIA